MINWLVRIKNKAFWVAFIPAVFLLIQAVGGIFGFEFDFSELSMKILAAVDALFAVLAIIGIVADPTTAGIGDSAQALTYNVPKPHTEDAYRMEGTDWDD